MKERDEISRLEERINKLETLIERLIELSDDNDTDNTYHKDPSVCNICGSQLDYWDKENDFSIVKAAPSASEVDNNGPDAIGYGSEYDGYQLNLHICCDCMDRIIKRCSISPVSYEGKV